MRGVMKVAPISAATALLLLAGPVSAVEMSAGEHLARVEPFARIIACSRCARKGQYRLARLADKYGSESR